MNMIFVYQNLKEGGNVIGLIHNRALNNSGKTFDCTQTLEEI